MRDKCQHPEDGETSLRRAASLSISSFSVFFLCPSLCVCLRVLCVVVVVVVVVAGTDKSNHLTRSSLWIPGAEQLYQTRRMLGGIGNVLFSTLFSNFKWVRSSVTFGEPLMHVITLRGPFMASRKLVIRDDTSIRLICSRNVKNIPVLPMKNARLTTTPTLHPALRVSIQNVCVCPCKSPLTGQDRTGQDRTGQDRTGQDRTGQDKTRQDKTKEKRKDETRQEWRIGRRDDFLEKCLKPKKPVR